MALHIQHEADSDPSNPKFRARIHASIAAYDTLDEAAAGALYQYVQNLCEFMGEHSHLDRRDAGIQLAFPDDLALAVQRCWRKTMQELGLDRQAESVIEPTKQPGWSYIFLTIRGK